MLGKMARPDLSTAIRTACCAGGRLHRASVLRECRKSAKIHAGLGVIWGIPVKIDIEGAKRQIFSPDLRFEAWLDQHS